MIAFFSKIIIKVEKYSKDKMNEPHREKGETHFLVNGFAC